MSCPSVTVVVPVFNHWDLIPGLLEKLNEQTLDKDAFEFLIVDNGSEFLPQDLVLPRWARLMVCATPGSYAARNMGIRSARGALLAFTDADCLPSPQWLQRGLDAYRGDLLADLLLVAGGVSMKPSDRLNMTRSEVFDVLMGLPQERYVRRGYAVTANLFVPAAAFMDVGFFDEARFSGGDAEFCRRAVSKGWQLQYCDAAEVVHPARKSWHELKLKQQRVKGGQLTSGTTSRRLMYAVAAFTPPLRQCFYALSSKKLTLKHRLSACRTLLQLWIVGISEVIKLLVGGKPERR